MKKYFIARSKNLAFCLRQNVMLWIVVVLLLLSTTYSLQPTLAADATPSSSIKSKLEQLKKEIASKAAKLKTEIGLKLRNKAMVGILKNKSETSLTLAAASGPKIVNINEDTLFQTKIKGKKFSKSSLKNEDYIAALGDVDETGVLTAKKVILVEVQKTQKTYLLGEIISISDDLITLKEKGAKNIAVSPPVRAKFKVNDIVILTGFFGKNEIFEAEFLYVIPKSTTY